MSLRPGDQISLARRRGAEVVVGAAQQAPESAVRTVAAREQWIRSLAPSLDRALDRQLARHRVSPPSVG
jgi:sugar phosphate isomerase/epimerase